MQSSLPRGDTVIVQVACCIGSCSVFIFKLHAAYMQ